MQSIGSYRADAVGWAADECCFQRKRLNLAVAAECLRIMIWIKIDVTEKLSRNIALATD